MKHILLACLPIVFLTACHIEDNYYYDEPMYQQTSRVYVERDRHHLYDEHHRHDHRYQPAPRGPIVHPKRNNSTVIITNPRGPVVHPGRDSRRVTTVQPRGPVVHPGRDGRSVVTVQPRGPVVHSNRESEEVVVVPASRGPIAEAREISPRGPIIHR